MVHIVLFKVMGSIVIAGCAMFYIGYRFFKTRNFNFIYIFSLLLILTVKLMLLYGMFYMRINLSSLPYLPLLNRSAESLSCIIVLAFPFLFHSLLKIPFRLAAHFAAGAVILTACALSFPQLVIFFLSGREAVSFSGIRVIEIMLLSELFYISGIVLFFYKNIADSLVKKIFGITSVFYLFTLLDSLGAVMEIFKLDSYSILIWAILAIYLLWGTFLIVFVWRYLNRPVAQPDLTKLPKNFIDAYSLTPKESEIALDVIAGKSNREIADIHFLSVKTVKNHIYSIFQKTHVKNRLELTLLVHSSAKE